MKLKTVKELFRKEESLVRSIRRRKERYAELEAKATSTGSFRYDQDKVTGSIPDGSRQEKLVVDMAIVESEIRQNERELEEVQDQIRKLVAVISVERIRKTMQARHVDHKSVEECMEKFGYDFETYKDYHHRGVTEMQKHIDNVQFF